MEIQAMGYLDTLINLNSYQQALAGKIEGAYASFYPPYEVQTPQYPFPNAYQLATTGYRKNAIVYAAINYRARAISEAPLRVLDISGDSPAEIDHHPLTKLMKKPNPYLTEEQLHTITEINLLVSGFCAWEMELTNGGDVLSLWPMRSDWCSFYRGEHQPIRAIRYQPYGLPPKDVPIENILLFQYYDPIFPLLKGLSPLAVALNVVEIDNFATSFLNDFFKRGAMPIGVLTTDQNLNPPEADRIREDWRNKHGGSVNWSEIAVLGKGATYQATGGAFSPGFDFNKLDGRDEVRMCMAIGVEPILIGSQVGLQTATYSNYSEARQAFYQGHIVPEWRYIASEFREQLLPKYESDITEDAYTVEFNTGRIKALQEDVTEVYRRVTPAWQTNAIYRDQYLELLGLDPVDTPADAAEPVKVYYSDTIMTKFNPLQTGEPLSPNPNEPAPNIQQPAGNQPLDGRAQQQEQAQNKDALAAAKEAEAKNFKAFAKKRIKEGKPDKLALFKFEYLNADEQKKIIDSIQSKPHDISIELAELTYTLRDAMGILNVETARS